MKNLSHQVIDWLEKSNLVNVADIGIETLMLVSKFGQLTTVITKGKECREEIGNCLINMIIICIMSKVSFADCLDHSIKIKEENLNDPQYILLKIYNIIGELSGDIANKDKINKEIWNLLAYLTILAALNNSSLLECLEISFKKIQSKKIIRFNGNILEETHEDYPVALAMMKATTKKPKKLIGNLASVAQESSGNQAGNNNSKNLTE